MKILLIHNPFKLSNPKTYLSWAIRKVTRSHWNHCAVELEIDNTIYISDFQSHYKFREKYLYWATEATNREVKTIYVESELTDKRIQRACLNATKYKGYDFIKIVNHFTKIKFGFTIFTENPDRFVCSEWVEFLRTGKQVNWAVPEDFENIPDKV